MRIYFYEGFSGKSSESRELLLSALNDYSGGNFNENDILVNDKGKPYVLNEDIEFSVSHSKQLWMVAIGSETLGTDIQVFKKCNSKGILEKLYSEDEIKYVELWGSYGFFKLWVRREALIKALSKSVFNEMPPLVDENHELIDEIKIDGKTYMFNDIEISDEIACSVCTTGDMRIEPVMMN